MAQPSFLVTKVCIPPSRPVAVARPHLTATLEREVVRHRLTVVLAPAGYGKSSLLAEWARSSSFAVAWLSLEEDDNDLERFLRYLVAAWREVQPEVVESAVGLLLGAHGPDRQAVLQAFVNVGKSLTHELVFVLDDYHLINEPAVHEAMGFLLDHLPPTLHFVLCSRSEPALPVARYRARQELFELRAEDLRFSQKESADFLAQQVAPAFSHENAAALQAQTEGWIAGLQLAALSFRFRPERLRSGALVSGRQRFIADYLREDVLAPLRDELRQFLLQTSILERMSGPLCAAVTGRDDCQALLEELERENLFLMPLDDQREWFRYHPLFADFLQQEHHRLYADEVAPLHRRAGAWHLAHELPEQAFRHAVAGDDAQCAIEIFDRYLNLKLPAGEFRVVQSWIDALPRQWLATYPRLELARAGLFAATGAVEACIRSLDDVEQRLTPAGTDEARMHRAWVTSVRCLVACIQDDLAQAEALSARALRELGEGDNNFRPVIYGVLGDTYRRHGRWQEARELYLRVLDVAPSPAVRYFTAHVSGALADLALQQGRLREAAEYWRKALTTVEERWGAHSLPLPVVGWLHIRLGEILYEWNDLAGAREHVVAGLERAELGGDVRALMAGYLLVARLALTEGDVEQAFNFLERARPLVEEAAFKDWTSQFERTQLVLWLAQGRLRQAVDGAKALLQSDELDDVTDREASLLGAAWVLIRHGNDDALGDAQTVVDHLLGVAEAEGRQGVFVEALAVWACAQWRRGDRPAALSALERVLRLAEPEGYVRLFADMGLPMVRLLQEGSSRHILPDYVARLLGAIDADLVRSEQPYQTLPEPLTEREREVLELVAAGLTNREIGERLVISPGTVKKHTSTIYGKLGVSNRTEAAARARELNLLS